MAHGKRYRQQYGKIQRNQAYPPSEAVSLIKETASAKFDETVELHLLLGLNVRHAEEQLRGTLALPHGLGKDVTVAVFAQGQQARDAEAAGADFVGGDDLAEKVEGGWTDFDVAIATPQMMGTVGKLGRVLGPQGKMPNPKVGTVTDDIEKAVTDSKAGKVEYRTDRQAIIHMTIGKASFEEPKLLDNYNAVIDEIVRAKPSSSKGKYIRSATLTTTMGPGIKVDSGKAGDTSGPRSAGPVEEPSKSEDSAPSEGEPEPEQGDSDPPAAEAEPSTPAESDEEQSQSDSSETSEGESA
jgi:large subunit ribosomal protein L1